MTNQISKISLTLMMLVSSLYTIAQDTKKVDIDINTKPDAAADASSIMSQPWVWVVGGAIFLLLLIALLKGGKRD